MQYIPEELIEQAFYNADLDMDENLREKYSGRGMYGQECFGIVYSYQSQLTGFFLHLDRIIQEEALEFEVDSDLAFTLSEATNTDSMAFDRIAYFPGFLIGEDPDDKEDE